MSQFQEVALCRFAPDAVINRLTGSKQLNTKELTNLRQGIPTRVIQTGNQNSASYADQSNDYTSKKTRDTVTKKAVISIDLASTAGTLRFVPGAQLPRHDKRVLEHTIATAFLRHLCQCEGSTFGEVQSNASDPPDVTFTYNRRLLSMELSELVPENRFEKDALMRTLRRNIISEINLGDRTRGFVVTVFLVNDYAPRIRPGHIHSTLAHALDQFFQHGDPDTNDIEVPDQIRNVVARISIFRAELAGDPRLEDDREPLIVFGAQCTMLIPEDDCPAIVESRLSRKGLHDLEHPTWLILWSSHHALASLRDELDDAIGYYLRRRPMNYERVFHLHLFAGSGVTEFPNTTPATGGRKGDKGEHSTSEKREMFPFVMP